MSNLHFDRQGVSGFLKKNGFFLALSICVIIVAAGIYMAITSTRDDFIGENDDISSNITSSAPETSSELTVNKPQSNVPKSSSKSEKIQKNNSDKELYIMPVNGEILTPFSGDKLIFSKTFEDWRVHTGVDIKAEIGTPVKAASDGVVTKISFDEMWGNLVEITHSDNLKSIYANLGKPTVKKDQKVTVGQIIGSVSDTAKAEISEVSHLHFEVKRDGKYVDPIVTFGLQE